jgi:ATP-dependent Clp protease ATP-binding subunit ClpC
MSERFSERARASMKLAREEAQRLNHECFGTEHILMGLVKESHGTAIAMLQAAGVSSDRVSRELESRMAPRLISEAKNRHFLSWLLPSPRLRQSRLALATVEDAMKEVRRLNDNYIGTEHLLLALLSQQDGMAAEVLSNMGLKTVEARQKMLDLLERSEREP